MAALTAERNTISKADQLRNRVAWPVAASVKIWKGSLVMIDAGYAKPGATATGKIKAGKALETVDNTTGAAGAKFVHVEEGTHKWANLGGDLVVAADVGVLDCFITDDQTVSKTSGGSTKSVAGRVMGLDTDGVWVRSLTL
jgi:hypothetical protein